MRNCLDAIDVQVLMKEKGNMTKLGILKVQVEHEVLR